MKIREMRNVGNQRYIHVAHENEITATGDDAVMGGGTGGAGDYPWGDAEGQQCRSVWCGHVPDWRCRP